MSDLIKLELVDVDGQVREAADGITEGNRRDFMRRAGIAGAGFVAGGVLFSGLVSPAEAAISTRSKSKANDVKILNYALTLEFLEAAFYNEANASGAIKDPVVAQFAKVVGDHENAHVTQLKKVLGSAAIKKGKYNFGATVTDEAMFKKTSQVLEDTGVSAYAGQGPNILQKPVVVAALSIYSVEARHAAWIRFINSGGMGPEATLPAPVSFDKAKSEKQVLSAVKATGFLA